MPFTRIGESDSEMGNLEWGAKRLANVWPGANNAVLDLLYNTPKLAGIDLEAPLQYAPPELPQPDTERVRIPDIFDIPKGNFAGEIIPSLLEQAPGYVAGGAVVRGLLGAARVGTVLGRAAIGAGEFAGGALTRDPAEVPVEAALGGVFGAAGTQDWRVRLITGLLAGGGSAAMAKHQGADATQTAAAGIGGLIQPFTMGRELGKVKPQPRTAPPGSLTFLPGRTTAPDANPPKFTPSQDSLLDRMRRNPRFVKPAETDVAKWKQEPTRATEETTTAYEAAAGEVPNVAPGGVVSTQPPWLQEAMAELQARGWNPKWPFVPADLQNKSFIDAIISDPTISPAVKKMILSFAPGGANDISLIGTTTKTRQPVKTVKPFENPLPTEGPFTDATYGREVGVHDAFTGVEPEPTRRLYPRAGSLIQIPRPQPPPDILTSTARFTEDQANRYATQGSNLQTILAPLQRVAPEGSLVRDTRFSVEQESALDRMRRGYPERTPVGPPAGSLTEHPLTYPPSDRINTNGIGERVMTEPPPGHRPRRLDEPPEGSLVQLYPGISTEGIGEQVMTQPPPGHRPQRIATVQPEAPAPAPAAEAPASTSAPAPKAKKLKLDTPLTPENLGVAAAQLGLVKPSVTEDGSRLSAADPSGANFNIAVGETLRDLRNAHYWKMRERAATNTEELAAVHAERDKLRGREPSRPKAPSQPVTADTTPPAQAKLEPVVILADSPSAEPPVAPLQPKLADMPSGPIKFDAEGNVIIGLHTGDLLDKFGERGRQEIKDIAAGKASDSKKLAKSANPLGLRVAARNTETGEIIIGEHGGAHLGIKGLGTKFDEMGFVDRNGKYYDRYEAHTATQEAIRKGISQIEPGLHTGDMSLSPGDRKVSPKLNPLKFQAAFKLPNGEIRTGFNHAEITIDGLPKDSVAGWEKDGKFYTRLEAQEMQNAARNKPVAALQSESPHDWQSPIQNAFTAAMAERGYKLELPRNEDLSINPRALTDKGSTYATFVSPDGKTKLAVSRESVFEREGSGDVWRGDPTRPMKDGFTLEIVHTDPSARGQGAASKIMKAAAEAADVSGATLHGEVTPVKSLIKRGQKSLTGKQLADWYARHGFEKTGRSVIKRTPKSEVSPTLVRQALEAGSKVDPSPGSLQSYNKFGRKADTERSLAAVVAGKKPVATPSGDNKAFTKKAKELGLKTATIKNRHGLNQLVAFKDKAALQSFTKIFQTESNEAIGKALGYTDDEIAEFSVLHEAQGKAINEAQRERLSNTIEEWVANDDKAGVMLAIKKAHKEGLISDRSFEEAKRIKKDRDMGASDIAYDSGVLDDLRNPELVALQRAEPVAPLQDAAPPTTSIPSSLENPLARASEPGYIQTTDVMQRAMELVGESEFNRLAEERIVKTGAHSEAIKAMAIENTARKILAKDMILKGRRLDVAGRESMLLQEILGETTPGVEGEIAALQAGKQTAPQFTEDGSGKPFKLKDIGDHGYIVNEAVYTIAGMAAAPLAGAAIGWTTSDNHKLAAAIMGAAAIGLGAHRFFKIARYLAKQHPEVQIENSYANRIHKMTGAIKEDLGEAWKAINIDPIKASIAEKDALKATYSDKVALWLRQNIGDNLETIRLFQRAINQVQEHAENFDFALRQLELLRGTYDINLLKKYFAGKPGYGHHVFAYEMKNAEVIKYAALAVTSRKILSEAILNSLGDKKGFLAAEIKKNFNGYLTRSFEAFHNPKWNPSEETILKFAKALGSSWGPLEVRLDKVRAYASEIIRNRGMYSELVGPKIAHDKTGESLHSILTKKEMLSPEAIEFLGKYDDPIQEMAATALKLVTGARSAEYFNILATSRTRDGLKFAYEGTERLKEMDRLEKIIAGSGDEATKKAAVATLQHLETYSVVFNDDAFGRLSGQYVKPEARDRLASYQKSMQAFASPLANNIFKLNNAIKYGHTVLTPLQYVRQLYTFPVLGIIAQTFPKDWKKAYLTMTEAAPEGERFTAEQLRLKRIGITGGDFVAGELRQDLTQWREGKTGKLFEQSKFGRGLRWWEEKYRLPDVLNRVAAFQKKEADLLVKYGHSPEGRLRAENEAIDHTNRYTMNYAAVPTGVIYGRQIPFVNQYLTFAYEMTRITKNLIQDAKTGDTHAISALGLMATVPFLAAGASLMTLSEKDREEWTKLQAMLPDYSRHNFRIMMGRNKQTGDFHYLDMTPIIPHDGWLRSLKAIASGDLEAAFATNPILGWENTPVLNVIMTMAMGRDRRTGEPFNTTMDQLHNIRREIAPSLLGGTEFDRLAEALTPNKDGTLGTFNARTGQRSSFTDIVTTHLISMRPYTVRPSILQQRAIARAQEMARVELSIYKRTSQSNASQYVQDMARERYQNNVKQIFATLQTKMGITPELEEAEP